MKSSREGDTRAHVKRILFFVTLDMFSIDYGYIGSRESVRPRARRESCGARQERKKERKRKKKERESDRIGTRRNRLLKLAAAINDRRLTIASNEIATSRCVCAQRNQEPARTMLNDVTDRVYKSHRRHCVETACIEHVHFRATLTHRETQPRARTRAKPRRCTC